MRDNFVDKDQTKLTDEVLQLLSEPRGEATKRSELLHPTKRPSADQLILGWNSIASTYNIPAAEQSAIDQVEKILHRLGDDNFKTRQAGSKELEAFFREKMTNPSAERAVATIMIVHKDSNPKTKDPEVTWRIGCALTNLTKDPQSMLKMLSGPNQELQRLAVNQLTKAPINYNYIAQVAAQAEKGTGEERGCLRDVLLQLEEDSLYRKVIRPLYEEQLKSFREMYDAVWNSEKKLDQKRINEIINGAEKFVADADKAYKTDPRAALARVVYPDRTTLEGGEILTELPSIQRLNAADLLTLAAKDFQKGGGDTGTVDKLQTLSASYIKEGQSVQEGYGRWQLPRVRALITAVKELNPDSFSRYFPISLLNRFGYKDSP